MGLSKHWITGKYNTHYLKLTSVIYGSVNWGSGKSETPWDAFFLNKEIGSFKDFKQAQLAVEKEAQIQANTINARLKDRVSDERSRVMTDDHRSYSGLSGLEYKHESVNHSGGEYAKGDAHTNSIESVWAVLKRGVHGTFHHVSTKHLDRYVDEFTFRLNAWKVSRHTTERLDSFVSLVAGKRITYKRLTKGSTWFDDGSLQVAEIV